MIDIHCHILPGVDDGAKDMFETIEMAKIAVREGIKIIIATPHYIEHEGYMNKAELVEVVENVNEELRKQNILLTVILGQEVYLTPNIITLLQKNEITTLNKSQYILIEFPMHEIPTYAQDMIYELRLMNIVPIIAHPERYHLIIKQPNLLASYIEQGALCQGNVGSLIGLFGREVQKTLWTLIKHRMIHFIATDAHSMNQRAPLMKEAYACVKEYNDKLAQKLFFEHPMCVMKHVEIEVESPIYIEKLSLVQQIKRIFKK